MLHFQGLIRFVSGKPQRAPLCSERRKPVDGAVTPNPVEVSCPDCRRMLWLPRVRSVETSAETAEAMRHAG